jgi:hypothetical protein
MIQQWSDADCEKRSPGERLEITIRVALDHRKAHDALAPLHLLAGRFGYRLETIEDTDTKGSATEAPHTITHQASRAPAEASQAVNAALLADADGLISRDELDDVHRECDEAIEAILGLKRTVTDRLHSTNWASVSNSPGRSDASQIRANQESERPGSATGSFLASVRTSD